MWKTMIYKELRETAGIAAIAIFAFLLLITSEMRVSLLPLTGGSQNSVPFLATGLPFNFVLVAGVFSAALGFRQTAWELWQGTLLFLFHRPASRGRLILAKLTAGFLVYLICSAVPLLVYAAWAALPGTHASPFFWSMTFPIWKLWIAMTIVYLGAFASGLLDGRWWGRRLLPLASACVASAAIATLPWWWLTAFPLLLLSLAVGVSIVIYISQARDYS